MRHTRIFALSFLSVASAFLIANIGTSLDSGIDQSPTSSLLMPAALAESPSSTEKVTTKLPVSKSVSIKSLASYKKLSVQVKDDGDKTSKYTGVPLRTLLAEMLPEIKIDTMPEWKALAKQELVMEVKGDDGYPGLITANEIATNPSGDRFILATECDGKPIPAGVRLICKMDEHHTRWVRQIINLRIFAAPKD